MKRPFVVLKEKRTVHGLQVLFEGEKREGQGWHFQKFENKGITPR